MDKKWEVMQRVRDPFALLDDGRDFFRPMELFLVIGGIHLTTQNPFYRGLFFCYRIVLCIQFFVWADRVYVAVFEWNSRYELIGVCTFFVAVVMILLRAGLTRVYLKKLEVVCGFLRRQFRMNRSERRDKSYRLLRWIALIMEVTFFVDQIIFYVFGVHRDRLYSIPDNLSQDWRVKLFFDVANASNHFVYSSLYVTNMMVLNSLLMAFEAELKEVVLGFEGILERVDQKVNERLKRQSKSSKAFGESLFWLVLEKDLNLAIARHSKLLEQLKTLGGFFELSFLLMFYMEILVLGCASFYINSQGLTINSFIVASYSGSHLLECYWFCRLVDNLNDTSKQIGSAIYNLDWHQRLRSTPCFTKQYRKIRTSLLIVMTKSQQNLGITCGGMFVMSAEAFQQLTKMIYTFLMFLINTTSAT